MAEPTENNLRHQRSVNRILRRARHEVGVRDFLTFFGARVWTVALALGAVVYSALGGRCEERKKVAEQEPPARGTDS